MATLIPCYPGDRILDLLLVVLLVVMLVSSAAWVLSRTFAGSAALRHLVLYVALVCSLAAPAMAWLCSAAGLTLVSIPLLCGAPARLTGAANPMVLDLGCSPSQPTTSPPPMNSPLPPALFSGCGDNPAPSEGNSGADVKAPSASGREYSGNTADAPVSIREIATGAMFVWAAGVFLALVRLARKCGRVIQLRRSSYPLEKKEHQALGREIAAELGIRRMPLLLVSRRTIAPLAVGFGRPAVILPQHLLGIVSESELRDVLVHEMAHLWRGDQRIVLLQELMAALYWPLVSVYALNRELQRAREEVCDNVVLSGRDAIGYSETLLHIAQLLVKVRPMHAGVCIFGGPGKLERRIAGLIDPRRNRRTSPGRKMAGAVLALFIALGMLASATRFMASVSAAAVRPPIGPSAEPAAVEPQAAGDREDAKSAALFGGRVIGLDGNAESGARLFLCAAHGPNEESGPARANADRRFASDAADRTYTDLDGLPGRRAEDLLATADGVAPDGPGTGGQDNTSLHTHHEPTQGKALDLKLARDDVPIHGRFLGPDGRPLAGARVKLDRILIPQGSDLDAYLRLMTQPSSLVLSDTIERSLDPRQIRGLTTQTWTNAEGRFILSGIGRDRLAELSVSAPTVVDRTLTVMTREGANFGSLAWAGGDPTQVFYGASFSLRLKPCRIVRGRVIDRDTHAPIAGMWVGPLGDPRALTDAQGRFTLTGLDPELLDGGNPNPTFFSRSPYRVFVASAAPGIPYQMGWVETKGTKEVVIECRRGIPFRLKVVDQRGQPVEAEVSYTDVQATPDVVRDEASWPVSKAAWKRQGIYEGFVLPGPGAVLVETPPGAGFGKAQVDPTAFFAPGLAQGANTKSPPYGTRDTLIISQGRTLTGVTNRGWHLNQRDYNAIVLINPPANSGPLELTATVRRDLPRRVSLIDPDGKPVVGAKEQGKVLRSASFLLTGLHLDRVRRLSFVKEDRRLIGFLLARDDGDTPYTVRLQPWGTVTGRLLDANGKPLTIRSGGFSPDDRLRAALLGTRLETVPWLANGSVIKDADAQTGELPTVEIDKEGRFRIERLVPGLRYSAKVYTGTHTVKNQSVRLLAGMAFESLVVRPGEVRDLGDIRTRRPVAEE